MMNYFIFSILLTFAEAGILHTQPNCITIQNIAYEEEILKYGVQSPYQLAIDHDTNTLFFSYTAKTTETFKIFYLSLKTDDFGLVGGISGGFAIAIDDKARIVYMGGEDGIYEFDYRTKHATKLNIKSDANIWQMFYKDALYFTTYPDEKAFVYKNQKVIPVPGLKDKVMILGVKSNGDYVYSNSSGLFTYIVTAGKVNNIGEYTVNGITSDIYGNIYFSTPSGIYFIDDKRNEIEEVLKRDEIYGVAIEGNGNIIYAREDSVIRLKPSKNKCVDSHTANDIL